MPIAVKNDKRWYRVTVEMGSQEVWEEVRALGEKEAGEQARRKLNNLHPALSKHIKYVKPIATPTGRSYSSRVKRIY